MPREGHCDKPQGKKRAVFLDRDGTIIEDRGYISKPDEVEFYPGAIGALKLLKSHGFELVIITNQSGIARRYLTHEALNKIHDKILGTLKLNNISIAAVYFCPHHPDEKCSCRKPNIGMVTSAEKRLNLDLSKSFVVGDKITDTVLAKRFGGKGVLVLTGFGAKEKREPRPDFVAKDLVSAVGWIIKNSKN